MILSNNPGISQVNFRLCNTFTAKIKEATTFLITGKPKYEVSANILENPRQDPILQKNKTLLHNVADRTYRNNTLVK
jgi:hypothetical protein